MKKFALKQSLESTDFLDLQGLVETVIQYAHDGGGIWVKVTIDPKHVVEMAKAFLREAGRGAESVGEDSEEEVSANSAISAVL
jgi:hypothetical protein